MSAPLKAPFPWFGGKSRVAPIVWERFGVVRNYVEPFFGSGAMLLGRPEFDCIETVNDLDCFVANFWRAVKSDPHAVAAHCDYPVNETDQQARHFWLVTKGRETLAGIMGDPDAYDAKIAGWWVWGLCIWIGSGWCSDNGGPWQWVGTTWVKSDQKGPGINRQLPHLGNAGQGINRQLPHLGSAGQGITDMLARLSDRLRRVRVCCGDWSRLTGASVTFKHGTTAVFLDPPYADTAQRTVNIYAQDCIKVAHRAREWAIENGENPLLRICLCGYDGEHDMPGGWVSVNWKARGGYGSQSSGAGRDNAAREMLWFSPHCLVPDLQQFSLFGSALP